MNDNKKLEIAVIVWIGCFIGMLILNVAGYAAEPQDLIDARIYVKGSPDLAVWYGDIEDGMYGRKYTPFCKQDCHLPLSVEVTGKTMPAWLCPSDLDYYAVKMIGNNNVANISYEYLTPYSYNWPTCLEGDYYSCKKWDNTTNYSSYAWEPLNHCILIENVHGINIRGSLTGPGSLDIVPQIFSFDLKEYDTWTWGANDTWTNPWIVGSPVAVSPYEFGLILWTPATNNTIIYSVDKGSSSNATFAYVRNWNLSNVTVCNCTYSGDTCTYSGGCILNQSTTYALMDATPAGKALNRVTNTSATGFPLVTDAFNITHAAYNTSGTWTVLVNEIFEFTSIDYGLNVTVPAGLYIVNLSLNGTQGNKNYTYPEAVAGLAWSNDSTTYLYRNESNVGNFTTTLAAGYYVLKANSTNNATGVSYYANVSKGSNSCTLSINESTPITYSTVHKASCSCANGFPSLYRNGTNVTAAENNTGVLFGAAAYVYVCNTTGTANYSAATDSDTFVIDQADIGFSYWINGAASNGTTVAYNQNISIDFNFSTLFSQVNQSINVYSKNSTEAYAVATNHFPNAQWINESFWNGWNNTLATDTYDMLMNWSGNANYSAFSEVIEFIIGDPNLQIIALDEVDNSSVTFNVTLSNDTFAFTDYDKTTFIANATNTPYGDNVLVTVWADGYGQRNYYFTLTNETNETLIAYLLDNSTGHWVALYTLTTMEQPISNTNITIEAITADGWNAVAQGITDDIGNYPFFLNPTTNYLVILTHSNYNDRNVSLIPSLTEYKIYLQSDIVSTSYWDYYKNVAADCSFNNTTRLLNCSWVDSSGFIENVSMEVTRIFSNSTTVSFCTNDSTNSSGWFACNFSNPANSSFLWTLYGDFDDEQLTTVPLVSGSWTDGQAVLSYGTTGLFITFIIVLFCGMIGVQMGNPISVILFTGLGIIFSIMLGFVTFTISPLGMITGLFGIMGVYIYKLRRETV